MLKITKVQEIKMVMVVNGKLILVHARKVQTISFF